MSAYLMQPEHLAALAREFVAIATRDGQAIPYGSENAEQAVFTLLLDENLKSVGFRYPDATTIADWHPSGEGAYTLENIPARPTDWPAVVRALGLDVPTIRAIDAMPVPDANGNG